MGEPGDRAAGDVAHRVAAGARGREPDLVEPVEDVGQRGELEVVELDRLARRELARAAAVLVRELADRAQLRRRDAPGGQLDAEHERPDLRLVVVEAPPLEADDVLLGDVRVARRDQGRQLVEDPERALLALQALEQLRLRTSSSVGGLAQRLRVTVLLVLTAFLLPGNDKGPRVPEASVARRRRPRLPSSRSPLREGGRGWMSHLTGVAPVAAASSGQVPQPLAMVNAKCIATSLHFFK